MLTVVVNHFKSKGCADATDVDADQGDGQSCWVPTRVAAAEALVDWLADHPTGVVDDDVQIIGDLNSYAKEDPIDVLTSSGYVDIGEELGDGYSFAFDGQWGTLDYSLSSPSLAAQVTGATEYHINSDEPSVLDYNTNFKSPAQIESLYEPDEFRVADHDPIVAGFELDSGIGDRRRDAESALAAQPQVRDRYGLRHGRCRGDHRRPVVGGGQRAWSGRPAQRHRHRR